MKRPKENTVTSIYWFLDIVYLAAFLLACICPWNSVNSLELINDDISVIMNISTFCVADRVNNVNASLTQLPGSAIVAWDPITPSPPSPASQYQVLYRPLSSTIVRFKNVDLGKVKTMLTGLQDSTTYKVYVRLLCGDSGGVGNLSDAVELTLVDSKPGNVTGIRTNITGNVVMVFWDPLPEDQWNGLPLGYYIIVHSPDSSSNFTFRVPYPLTSYSIGLPSGLYSITILAVNGQRFSVPSNQVELSVSTSNSGALSENVPGFKYPWAYILASGLVCVMTIIIS